MPINRPVTKTIISTTQWGIPITDEVNALRTELDALKPTAWTGVAYANGWMDAGSGQAPMRYRKQGDLCWVQGSMKSGSLNNIAFILPVGFRPATTIRTVQTDGPGLAQFDANGNVWWYGPTNSINSISAWFPIA